MLLVVVVVVTFVVVICSLIVTWLFCPHTHTVGYPHTVRSHTFGWLVYVTFGCCYVVRLFTFVYLFIYIATLLFTAFTFAGCLHTHFVAYTHTLPHTRSHVYIYTHTTHTRTHVYAYTTHTLHPAYTFTQLHTVHGTHTHTTRFTLHCRGWVVVNVWFTTVIPRSLPRIIYCYLFDLHFVVVVGLPTSPLRLCTFVYLFLLLVDC